MYFCSLLSNLSIKVSMSKKILATIAFFAIVFLFSACQKQCVCKTTRITATTHDVMENEMGKMTEKDCLEYNGTVTDGEGITRIIDCHLN